MDKAEKGHGNGIKDKNNIIHFFYFIFYNYSD